MAARDDVQRAAAALEKPQNDYMTRLETIRRALVAGSGEAARQLEVFSDRIGDLTIEELRELYDETFQRDTLAAIGPLISRFIRRPSSRADARVALDTLAPMLDRLEADRNPFAHVVRALCCLLLARVSHSRKERPFQ
jgi:nitrate reductase assembly molybdenum cofactor insertion protein NarJ